MKKNRWITKSRLYTLRKKSDFTHPIFTGIETQNYQAFNELKHI